MKKIIPILLLAFWTNFVHATNYYFSSVSGDDSRTASQAQNPATPWRTLTKLNSYFSSLAVGDSVLFKRGETFYGSITAGKSGTSGSPIVIGAYGTGANPIITGFQTVSSWVTVGVNLWESATAVSTLSTCNIISNGGVNYAKGRVPDSGYWTIGSTNGSTTITDNTNLNASVTNWTGATVAVRELMYEINTHAITGHSGSTITFGAGAIPAGWGYFIQDDPRACNLAGDWAYNTSTKKVTVYSVSTPGEVKIPTIEEGVNLNGKDYIRFVNLDFQGYNTNAINTNSRTGIRVINCSISFAGVNAIYAYPNSNSLYVTGCTITDCGSRGVHGGSSSNAVISGNTITRIGHFAGMGSNGDDSYCAVISNGDYSTVSSNTITDAGYEGIRWDGNGTNIVGNLVSHTTYIKDDGGAIYTYSVQNGNVQAYQVKRTVRDNIIINFPGASAGSIYGTQGAGIYIDGQACNVDIKHNTVIGPGKYGIFKNGGRALKTDSNTVYNSTYPLYLTKVSGALDTITVTNNYFIAAASNAAVSCGNRTMAANYKWNTSTIPTTFTASNNLYGNLLDQTNDYIYGVTSVSNCYSVAAWQSLTGKESGSRKAPLTYPNTSYIRVEYNETGSNKTVNLVNNYRDVDSVLYAGTITLAPYSSKVLTYISANNIAPTVTITGGAQTLQLPLDSTVLIGSASDADGTISTYAWTKVSGGSATIVSPSSSNTKITGLQAGTYVFQLQVTDNAGAQATATVSVVVSPSVIQTQTIKWIKTALIRSNASISWAADILPTTKAFEIQRKVRTNYNSVQSSTGAVTIPAIKEVTEYKGTYSLSTGLNYFRIKIVNNDSSVSYSDVFTVKKK